ncbi:hypothetical protein HFO71_24055 [Rhizobium laguerreae]|uniref:hypothetical protein n=1 Tax=Rhizobium laguerreae TaxID=1076926 RepID=UPI001C921D27|nr:hypothetical protein [Rhizobium laguerreae]MBY3073392.1 hypothetical protein [Rhizobium laguerreae]
MKRTHLEVVSSGGTTYTFGVNLGIDFPGRRIVICVAATSPDVSGILNRTAGTLAGASLGVGPGGAWFNPGVNVNMGILIDAPGGVGGTSATFSMSYDRSINHLSCVVYSVANIPNSFHSNSNGGQPLTSTSTTINVDTNGVVIAHAIKADSTDVNLSGVNEDIDFDLGSSGVRVGVGFQNRMSAQTGRSIGMTGSGASNACELAVVSFGS